MIIVAENAKAAGERRWRWEVHQTWSSARGNLPLPPMRCSRFRPYSIDVSRPGLGFKPAAWLDWLATGGGPRRCRTSHPDRRPARCALTQKVPIFSIRPSVNSCSSFAVPMSAMMNRKVREDCCSAAMQRSCSIELMSKTAHGAWRVLTGSVMFQLGGPRKTDLGGFHIRRNRGCT